MKKKIRLIFILFFVIFFILFIKNYNGLSKLETMDKFLDLISQSQYDNAKKYITSNFEWNLSSIKEKKLDKAEKVIYKYENYYLDTDYDIAYIYSNIKEIKTMAIYKFKLKKTIFGYKIDKYEQEYVKY